MNGLSEEHGSTKLRNFDSRFLCNKTYTTKEDQENGVVTMENRYSRQILLPEIGTEGQSKLAASSVLVLGCGALGTVISETMVRAGVGKIHIVDRDIVEVSNLQRQVLFDENDALKKMPKAHAAAIKLRAINSAIEVEGTVADLNAKNVEALISDASLVLDGTDNMETRYLLNDACVKHSKPWIYGGCVGTGGLVLPVLPGIGPCLRCVFKQAPPPGTLPTCDVAGVLATATIVTAAMQSTEAIKLIIGNTSGVGRFTQVDVWQGTQISMKVDRSDDCPACALGQFDFLTKKSTTWVTSLCGRNAVQIVPAGEVTLNLERILDTLPKETKPLHNGITLTFTVNEHELVIFPDGRALVKGTTDKRVGRSLYASYIGS